MPAGSGAPPAGDPLKPPPTPHTRVTVGSGDHPLLEFSHPALGIAGLACWFAYVFTHDAVFGWIALGVLLVTVGAGLGWLASNARAARPRAADGGDAPGRRDADPGGPAGNDASRAEGAASGGSVAAAGRSADPAEPGAPRRLIAAHGLIALATVALVLVTLLSLTR